MTTVGVSIASIPPRAGMLARALGSVCRQTRPVDQISVHVDHASVGAAEAKNRALEAITTDWVAFLDDDDELLPHHIERLLACADETGADLVYPWYQGINPHLFRIPDINGQLVDPLHQPWIDDIHIPYLRTVGNFIPDPVIARTDLVKKVGGFAVKGSLTTDTCDDWALWERLLDVGAKFAHLPEITWTWMGHPGHTSGRPWATCNAYAGYAAVS
jgi:glycosyltransferase involved in cell wall biosynthesis